MSETFKTRGGHGATMRAMNRFAPRPNASTPPARQAPKGAWLALKLLLSAGVGWALVQPLLQPEAGGVLRELEGLGPWGAAGVLAVFLGLVWAYARDLRRCLAWVEPAHRAAAPGRVWLMFVLPYNFIEDFCIVHDVARSLRAQAAHHPGLARLRSFGWVSGWGWCAAQLLSLLPNAPGEWAAWLALLLWAWHWAFIRRALGALGGPVLGPVPRPVPGPVPAR